jgi:hypothetical protein
MTNIKLTLSLVFIFITMGYASAENAVFCDYVPMKSGNWVENFTLPKFDSNLGTLKAVEITVDMNLSQQVKVENTGEGNSTINSSTESVLTLILPDGQDIKVNVSQSISRDLSAFDGMIGFSGPSGINLTKSASSGTNTYPISDISGFIASTPGEELLINGMLKNRPSISVFGSASFEFLTGVGAGICIFYQYEIG